MATLRAATWASGTGALFGPRTYPRTLPVVVCAFAAATIVQSRPKAPARSRRGTMRRIAGIPGIGPSRGVTTTSLIMEVPPSLGRSCDPEKNTGSGIRGRRGAEEWSLGGRRAFARQPRAARLADHERRRQPLVASRVFVLAVDRVHDGLHGTRAEVRDGDVHR